MKQKNLNIMTLLAAVSAFMPELDDCLDSEELSADFDMESLARSAARLKDRLSGDEPPTTSA